MQAKKKREKFDGGGCEKQYAQHMQIFILLQRKSAPFVPRPSAQSPGENGGGGGKRLGNGEMETTANTTKYGENFSSKEVQLVKSFLHETGKFFLPFACKENAKPSKFPCLF